MRSLKVIAAAIIAVSVLASGCDYVDQPIGLEAIELPRIKPRPEPQPLPTPVRAEMQNRFTDVRDEKLDAVGNAVMWSEKYDQLSENYRALTDDNMTLTMSNNDLKKKIIEIETQLADTRQELDDANLFLQDMHKELTRWKGDVIGFRQEIRHADSAQLEALTRILKLLGAEMIEPVAMNTQSTPN